MMKLRISAMRMWSVTLTVLPVLLIGLAGEGHAHTGHLPESGRQVVVDTDMGLDDVRAVFALLADSTVQIDAFVTVSGSAAPGKGTDNLVGLLEAARSSHVRVIRGVARPDLAAPPWRQTANQLGGAPFPPPRGTEVTDYTPEALAAVAAPGSDVEYLALGPLSNLGALAIEDPAGLARFHTIYIPAVPRDGIMSDWNLTYDAEASRAVLGSAAEVVILDISAGEEVDALEFLSSLRGESPALLWTGRLLGGLGSETGHAIVYDELAAVSFLRQDLLESDGKTYEASSTDGGFRLAESAGGNVRVARLADTAGALAALRQLFARDAVGRHPLPRVQEIAPEALLRTFHGHLGPYVVIGYRMGVLALAELDSEGHFGILAEVHSPFGTPRSCLIDGVQLGSGCTLGKGNIAVEEAPEPAWAVFTAEGGGQVTIRLQPGIPALVRDLVNAEGVEAAGRAFFEMRSDSLFSVEHRGH
jgi:formylmethanofuran dehydrogenase subunit E